MVEQQATVETVDLIVYSLVTHEQVIKYYHKTSNIRCTILGNKLVDHWDVVGASPVGTTPTTSSFST